MDLNKIRADFQELSEDNDWNVYHTPKNLAMAVSVEAGELLEHFQWVTEEDSLMFAHLPAKKEKIGSEIADVFFYLLRLSDKLGIDLEKAVLDKAAVNKERFQGMPDYIDE